jgi:predicted GNAT family acetyltransferase
MNNPFVYYRIESLNDLKRNVVYSVSDLDWHADLSLIQRFYARFGNKQINPDEFDQYIGNPVAIKRAGEIISFAIPLSFRDGETEIGGVATVPDQQNKGYCKALISEMAFRILNEGKIATLTTEKTNLAMQKAAETIGMKRFSQIYP